MLYSSSRRALGATAQTRHLAMAASAMKDVPPLFNRGNRPQKFTDGEGAQHRQLKQHRHRHRHRHHEHQYC